MSNDPIHINAAGYTELAKQMAPVVMQSEIESLKARILELERECDAANSDCDKWERDCHEWFHQSEFFKKQANQLQTKVDGQHKVIVDLTERVTGALNGFSAFLPIPLGAVLGTTMIIEHTEQDCECDRCFIDSNIEKLIK